MKNYYCLIDKELGMKSCGLTEKYSSYDLDPQLANKSISISKVKKSEGYACYFHIKASDRWTDDSTVHIYPSRITRAAVYMVAGATRADAKTLY